MKVLALLGSPRRNGNTDIMAEEVLHGACDAGAITQKIAVDEYYVRPIGEVCDNSRERNDPRSDDDFPKLLDEFLNADVVIWATPVYWAGLSAQLKCFLDRMSSYYNREPFINKFKGKGHAVLCAYGRTEAVHGEFVTEPMKLVVQVLKGRYLGDVCASSTYPKGIVREMPDILNTCYTLGKKIVEESVNNQIK